MLITLWICLSIDLVETHRGDETNVAADGGIWRTSNRRRKDLGRGQNGTSSGKMAECFIVTRFIEANAHSFLNRGFAHWHYHRLWLFSLIEIAQILVFQLHNWIMLFLSISNESFTGLEISIRTYSTKKILHSSFCDHVAFSTFSQSFHLPNTSLLSTAPFPLLNKRPRVIHPFRKNEVVMKPFSSDANILKNKFVYFVTLKFYSR